MKLIDEDWCLEARPGLVSDRLQLLFGNFGNSRIGGWPVQAIDIHTGWPDPLEYP